jgi:hypothetical protein
MSFDEVCCLPIKIPRLWYTLMTFVLYGIFLFQMQKVLCFCIFE